MSYLLSTLPLDNFNCIFVLIDPSDMTRLWLTGSKLLMARLAAQTSLDWTFDGLGPLPFPTVVQYLPHLTSLALRNHKHRIVYPFINTNLRSLPMSLRKLELRSNCMPNHFAGTQCRHNEGCIFDLRSRLPDLEELIIGNPKEVLTPADTPSRRHLCDAIPRRSLRKLEMLVDWELPFDLLSPILYASDKLEAFIFSGYLTTRPSGDADARPWPQTLEVLELFQSGLPPTFFESLPPNIDTLLVIPSLVSLHDLQYPQWPSSLKHLYFPVRLEHFGSLPRNLESFIMTSNTSRGRSELDSIDSVLQRYRLKFNGNASGTSYRQFFSVLPPALTIFGGDFFVGMSASDLEDLPDSISDLIVPITSEFKATIEGSLKGSLCWSTHNFTSGSCSQFYRNLTNLTIQQARHVITEEEFRSLPTSLKTLTVETNAIANRNCFSAMPLIQDLTLLLGPFNVPIAAPRVTVDVEEEWSALPASLTSLSISNNSNHQIQIPFALSEMCKGLRRSLHHLQTLSCQMFLRKPEKTWDFVDSFPPHLTNLSFASPCQNPPGDALTRLPSRLRSLIIGGRVDPDCVSAGVFKTLPKSLSVLSIDTRDCEDDPSLFPPYLMRLKLSYDTRIFAPHLRLK